MLFGVYANNSQIIDQNTERYGIVLQEITFDNCLQTEIVHQNIKFTVISHNSLPEQENYFIDEANNIVTIISGNIYNLSFLLNEENLTELSAAEYINYMYRQEGLAFLTKLNGGFSIVIADLNKDELYLVKDLFGIVPITYCEDGDCIYFSSDTHGLAKGLYSSQDISEEFIYSRFYDYESNYTQTPNSQIQKVLPGHYLRAKKEKIESVKYWDPDEIMVDSSIEFNEAVNQLRELVLSSVKLRAQSKFTAGTHMSGGLDSTLIATLAKSHYPDQNEFCAFTWSPSDYNMTSDLDFDERENLKEQCRIAGLEPIFTNIEVEDYDHFVSNWRCPSESIFESKVIDNALDKKVNLLFSGWGGDESIGLRDEALLYESFRTMHVSNFFKLFRRNGIKAKLMHLVNNVILPFRRREYFKYKIRPSVYQYLKRGIASNDLDTDKKSWYRSKKDYQLGLFHYYHIAQRCEDWYINGQRNGVVYRYPLLDKRIVEYTLKLPAGLFVDDKIDRPIMRAIGKDIITEKIRSLQKQNDPVTMRNAMGIQQKAFKTYLEQFPQFRKNAYLSFVDLDRLELDLRNEMNSSGRISKGLGFALYYVKVVHEYVRHYHENMPLN